MAHDAIGRVGGIWIFPVKSMKGARHGQAVLTPQGFPGDRAYALIDRETGRVVSAKSVRLFPDLFGCEAAYPEPPRPGNSLPPVQISLPDGNVVRSDMDDSDKCLSDFFGRDVTLSRVAPERLAFFDLSPVSVLTTSTLDQLRSLEPDCNFDERRFRMNVIVECDEPGFVENAWVDRDLAVGGEIRLHVSQLDARCVMTTLAQDELPHDTGILRTLVRHNRVQVADAGMFPCAGVYAVVKAPGYMRTGDSVSLG